MLNVNQLNGFNSSEDLKPYFKFITSDGDTSSTGIFTKTWSSISFGEPWYNRKILVAITCRDDVSSDVNSVTIGGVTASEVFKFRNTINNYLSLNAFFIADVPSGVSGDVVINYSGTVFHNGITLWSLYNLEKNETAIINADTDNGPIEFSIDTQPGDWLFGVLYQFSSSISMTWTGMDKDSEPTLTHSGASLVATTTETPRNITVTTLNSGFNAGSVISFRPGPLKYTSGLYGEKYNGFFDSTSGFFNIYPDLRNFFIRSNLQGQNGNFNNISSFTTTEFFSWMWFGYFRPPTSGTYVFYTSSDDASYVWIGDNALYNYTRTNALVDNGGSHTEQEVSGTIDLAAGVYYPFRVIFGNNQSISNMTLSFSGPGIAKRTSGSGYYFNINN